MLRPRTPSRTVQVKTMNTDRSVKLQTGCLLLASAVVVALIALSLHPFPAVAQRVGADILDAPSAVAVPLSGAERSAARERAETARGLGGEDAVAAVAVPVAFRRCALRAICGDFGPLRPWQRAAYERGLSGGVAVKHVRQTCYGPWEGYDRDKGCAHGYGCSEIIAAANALRARTVIWIMDPAQLRVVGDTGAAWNDPRARSQGCAFWIDLWIPYRGWQGLGGTVHRNIAVLP